MLNQKKFLSDNNISLQDFQKSWISWDDLCHIYDDYISPSYQMELKSAYESIIANVGLLFPWYSIRARIKDPQHLMRKIIKCKLKDMEISSEDKSHVVRNINVWNYKEEIHDLIGIRISHNFRSQDQEIYNILNKSGFNSVVKEKKFHHGMSEKQENIAYWKSLGFTTKCNPDTGYRSHHYIIRYNLWISSSCYFELQTRTVYEDAWWEIDHHLRYPNAMKDPIITHFSSVLNNISSVAVDLCSFMEAVQNKQLEIEAANNRITKLEEENEQLKTEIRNTKTIPHVNFGQIDPKILQDISTNLITSFPKIEPLKFNIFDGILKNANEAIIQLQDEKIRNMNKSHFYPKDISDK